MNSVEPDAGDEGRGLGTPAIALLTATAVGFAVGAAIWQYRRSHYSNKFSSFDRAVNLARSGAADTVQNLRRHLRKEGYSASAIEGRTKKYFAQLIDAANRRI